MIETSFVVGGCRVAADLYLPTDLKKGERRPALVIGTGFGSVKAGLLYQGQAFSAAGYVVLAIDYRSFGKSGGEVRGELFPNRMVEDFRGGISYLETRPEVDPEQIGIWGTSFGGALVLSTAALDGRVKATVAQVPIVDGRHWMQWLRTPEQWDGLLRALVEDRRNRFAGKPSARIPIVGRFSSREVCGVPSDDVTYSFANDPTSVMRSWQPDPHIALESIEKVIQFVPASTITWISPRPLCIVTNTGYEAIHPREPVLEAYRAAFEPKEIHLLPYDQLGLYSPPGDRVAFETALSFYNKHIPVRSQR